MLAVNAKTCGEVYYSSEQCGEVEEGRGICKDRLEDVMRGRGTERDR